MNRAFLDRFDRHANSERRDTLVVFIAVYPLDLAAVAEVVEKEIAATLVPDEIVFVGRSGTADMLNTAFNQRGPLGRLKQRVAGRARITMIDFDANGCESARKAIDDAAANEIGLSEIRQRGGTTIFRQRSGFVEATNSYHFRNPSGRHTTRFIRLSNILVLHAEISFVAFCVLPLIPASAMVAYVDTPSLFTVIAAVNDHLRALSPSRAAILADSFRSYDGFKELDLAVGSTAIVLISASSSGGLAAALTKLCRVPAGQITHLLYLGSNAKDQRIAVDLASSSYNPGGYDVERESHLEGACRMCTEGSATVTLHGDQFDIEGPQPKPLKINATAAPPGLADTMDRLIANEALTIEVGKRQFNIDSAKLFGALEFAKRFDYFVRRHVPAGAIRCILSSDDARPFGERIAGVSGQQLEFWDRDRINELRDETEQASSGNSAIVIIAPVIESGRILLDISRELRCLTDTPLIFLVGVGKFESKEQRDTLASNLTLTKRPHPHLFSVVEELILPLSSSPNAWDAEIRLLSNPEPLGEALAARRLRLEQTSSPLTNDLFLGADEGRELRIRDGFAFWHEEMTARNASQADVHFTMASVLQQLRANATVRGKDALRTSWFHRTLLDPGTFGRYNDGVIQASILRAARPAELDYSDNAAAGQDVGRFLRGVVESSDRPRGEAAAEFLIALGTRRLKLPPVILNSVLEGLAAPSPLVNELVVLCRNQLIKC